MLDNLKKSFIEESQATRIAEEKPIKDARLPELSHAVPFILSVLTSVHGAGIEHEPQPTATNQVTASETLYVDTSNYVPVTELSFEDQARQLVDEAESFVQSNDQEPAGV